MMGRALELAGSAWGRVHPNPMVGAVLVRDGVVVGEGYHREFGGLHAEAEALAQAGERARGATLYVTLEPCAHTGQQPPCADAIIRAGVARVVVAVGDPNPEAQGGTRRLLASGIPVETGLMAHEAARLNVRFMRRFAPGVRPWVAIKLAVSMDGRIADATGASRWISGEAAREWVHRLRAGMGAIAVGAATALADDARLTVRGSVVPRVPPARVVFDRRGRLPAGHGIFADAADVPLYMVTERADAGQRAAWEAAGARVIEAHGLREALRRLQEAGLDSVLVEGGGTLAGSLLQDDLVDRIYQVQSPVWLGDAGVPAWGRGAAPAIGDARRWHTVERVALGDDTLLVLEP